MDREQAIEIAAQCWCDEKTKTLVMEPKLAEVIADKLMDVYEDNQFFFILNLLIDPETNEPRTVDDTKAELFHQLDEMIRTCDQEHCALLFPLLQEFKEKYNG